MEGSGKEWEVKGSGEQSGAGQASLLQRKKGRTKERDSGAWEARKDGRAGNRPGRRDPGEERPRAI